MLHGFCSKFHTLSCSAKKCEHRLRFDKVTDSYKVGTFLRHSVDISGSHLVMFNLEMLVGSLA